MNTLKILYVFLFGTLIISSAIAQPYAALLDPGHRNNDDDYGAHSPCNGDVEAYIVLGYAVEAWLDLGSANAIWEEYMTRAGEQVISLQQRVAMANNTSGSAQDAFGIPIPLAGVALFYSVHANSSTNTTASGTEIFYYDHETDDDQANNNPERSLLSHRTSSISLAAFIHETQSLNPLASWRGVKDDTQAGVGSIYVLRRTNMPAVLLEAGFLSNSTECNNIVTTLYTPKAGDGITKGILCMNPESLDGWVDHVINDDISSVNFSLSNGNCMLVENTNSGGTQDHDVVNSTITFNSGSFIVVEPNTRLIPDNMSTIQNNGGAIFLAPGAEIVINGLVELVSGGVFFAGDGSCFFVKENGELKLGSGQTLEVNNDGIIISEGGKIVLEDNSKIIFDETSNRLEVRPGSIIELGDNAEIVVKGQIDAQGTAAEPISFKSLYTNPTVSNYWKGITINTNGGSEPNHVIKHAVIEHAFWGISAKNVPVTVRNSTIRNCQIYGIRLENSNSTIRDNLIEDVTLSAGIYSSYSDAYIRGNTIRDNTQSGIYLYQSSPTMYENHLEDNTPYGVYAYNYSAPQLGVGSVQGNNIIEGSTYGIYASYYADPFLGVSSLSGPKGGSAAGGYNSLYNNTKAIKAQNYCNIEAQYNWWGQYPVTASLFNIDGTSSVNYSNALSYDPNLPSGPGMVKNTGNGFFADRELLNMKNDNQEVGPNMNTPRISVASTLPSPLSSNYHQTIRQFPDEVASQWALIKLLQHYSITGSDSGKIVLGNIINAYPEQAVTQVAMDLLTREYIRQDDYAAAIANAAHIAQHYPDTESEKTALFDLFNFHFQEENSEQASVYLANLKSKYPNDALTNHAVLLFNGDGHSAIAFEANKKTETPALTSKLPTEFALLQNYPNPFNPQTTINYHLPAESRVKLAVYNVLGQKVATLANTYQGVGAYQAVWNGLDDHGKAVPSGVYIYRMSAESISENNQKFVQQKKMILMR